jgi:hypothetical protein
MWVLVLASTAAAEQWVYTGYVGTGASASVSSQPGAQASVALASTLGLTDTLNLEIPLDIAFVNGPTSMVLGIGVEKVWWRSNHWRWSSGGGLALGGAFTSSVPWLWGPYGQSSVRWLVWWGLGFSLDVRVLVPVVQGNVSPLSASGPSPWRAIVLPSLSVYEEF